VEGIYENGNKRLGLKGTWNFLTSLATISLPSRALTHGFSYIRKHLLKAKGIFVHAFNYSPRHEDVWG
jgi:hypothetical protein